MNTEHIKLTDLWHNSQYTQVGNIINKEDWSRKEVADFCSYFAKYVGLSELEILHKFL